MHRTYLRKTKDLIVFFLFCAFTLNLYLLYQSIKGQADVTMISVVVLSSLIIGVLLLIHFQKDESKPGKPITKQVAKTADFKSEEPEGEYSNAIVPGTKELNFKIKELNSINSILAKNLRSKDRLLKLVSHDLKAPLRNVIGLTDSIMRKYSDEIDIDLINRLNRIKKNIEKEFHLISDILSDVRTNGLQNKQVDLNLTIKIIISQLSFEIQSKNIEIQIAKPLPALMANGEILKHIFQNLIDNACKSLTNSIDNKIIIDCRTGQYEYIFSIRDNGPGIPAELRENLFEFDTTAIQNSLEGQGSGLGLPLVNTFVNMINGKIWFKTKTGSGTIFYLSLPKVLIN